LSRNKEGTVWTDQIPLLEEIADFQGRPGGIAGVEYAYIPLDQIMAMTSEEAPLDHPHTGRGLLPADRPHWRWTSASPQVFRVVDSGTNKSVDFQILQRGKPLNGTSPGWYRCRAFVHTLIPERLGWGTAHTKPPAPPKQAVVQTQPKPQQAQGANL
jgi:hypothetical protein